MARTKAQKKKEWQEFVEYLKSLPPEKLSQPAKWTLEQEEKGIEYWVDHRAVLK